MKLKGIICGLSSLLLTTPGYAINPVLGIYTDLGAGFNFTPNITITRPTVSCNIDDPSCVDIQTNKIKLDYKMLGQVFGGVGYRWTNFRVEGIIFGGGNKINKIRITTPNGDEHTLEDSSASGDKITFKGSTQLVAFMANGIFQYFRDTSDWMPYAGLGIGFGSANTSISLQCNPTNFTNPPTSCNGDIPGAKVSSSESTPVGEFIVGASYFMDDYSTIYFDYRFVTTGSLRALDTRYQIHTFNIGFNFAMHNFFGNT